MVVWSTRGGWLVTTVRKGLAMLRRVIIILFCLLIGMMPGRQAAAEQRQETPEQRDARMAWWREARFGMFIHWGLFSAAGGTWEGKPAPIVGCYLQQSFNIDHEVYRDALMPKFTGERFDADFIAQLAEEAGMKYVVAITKHHEGFCLFDSQLTDYKITNTPAGRDWIAELSDAVRNRGLRMGFYYSMIDWAHPDYPRDVFHPDRDKPEARQLKQNFDRYLEYMHGQYRELLTRYGRVDIIWHDFSYGEMAGETWRAAELMDMIRTLQPHIISNNRLTPIGALGLNDLGYGADFLTPEQHIPPNGFPGIDFEVCQTINKTWEYTHYDREWKSTTALIRELIDVVSKGGNYLLNIGPKPDGTVPESTIDKLRAIGRWMDVHGDSIYGTVATPFKEQLPWGRCTQKRLPNGQTRLYLHVFNWPFDSVLRVPALENKVVGARMMSLPDHPALNVRQDEGTGELLITLPIAEPNDHASVVMLDVEGPAMPVVPTTEPDATGRISLEAVQAQIHGNAIYDATNESVGHWTDMVTRVSWAVRVPQPGRYRVEVTYGCAEDDGGGGRYAIDFAGKRLEAASRVTGGWFNRRTDIIGEIHVTEPGRHDLTVSLVDKPGLAVFDLQRIVLHPLDTP